MTFIVTKPDMKVSRIKYWSCVFLLCLSIESVAQQFPLALANGSVSFVIDANEFPGVVTAAKNLQTDIERVTSLSPQLYTNLPTEKNILLIGTIGKNRLIEKLIDNKKLDVSQVAGKWEASLTAVVEHPFPNVERALVIAGSDKRGTIFGIYGLSEKIGVSPWSWWADVPVKKQKELYVSAEKQISKATVKYRGIFINDEAPALSGWVTEKFGGFNHKFYEKVFELILRLRGNYLWPAMWGRAIYDDDALSAKIADEYGVVIGTSHHEPMMRAHVEWQRYGKGEWNYEKNQKTLQDFWRKGIERMGSNESIVSLGMRGDGDMAMSKETNVALLERIVKDQRQIIKDVTHQDPELMPQMWALYKEVQEYYDEGMRVPDDVTLLLCDDNWGNIRKLPRLTDPKRRGGYGIYYHFDYVGGPRNYKWLNTNQIERVWEQMNMAYNYGVNTLWVVNVGDIKPMEMPIEFFLDMAWNPELINATTLGNYVKTWAANQFGEKYAAEIASILSSYTKFNSRIKPELLSPETYSRTNYREAERVVDEYNQIAAKAKDIYEKIDPQYRDAYYQLVLFPVLACSNLNELYVTAGKNHLYAKQGRMITNELAKHVMELFQKDAALTKYFNDSLARGKWRHMMDQTHIGYTSWQQPDKNNPPQVLTIDVKPDPELGVAIEGSESWWPNEIHEAVLPSFDALNQQSFYIEIFNRGSKPFSYAIMCDQPWIKFSAQKDNVEKQKRVDVSIDWEKVPKGNYEVPFVIRGAGKEVKVYATVNNSIAGKPQGFIETNGYVSIEGEHYTKAVSSKGMQWTTIPNLGRTGSSVSLFPVAHSETGTTLADPHLEYDLFLISAGEVKVNVYLSPTLDFHNRSLRYAIAIDDESPQIVSIHELRANNAVWEKWVAGNIIIKTSNHKIASAENHTLKIWAIDAGVVLQKIVVDAGGLKESYLGPPESKMITHK